MENNVLITDLPSYNDNEGTVSIGYYENNTLVIADKFQYLDDYH